MDLPLSISSPHALPGLMERIIYCPESNLSPKCTGFKLKVTKAGWFHGTELEAASASSIHSALALCWATKHKTHPGSSQGSGGKYIS